MPRIGPWSRRALVLVALVAPAVVTAQPTRWATILGPEAPGAQGSGRAWFTYDPGATTLRIQATFSGLSGNTTVAHIHCCTAMPEVGTAGVAVVPPTLPGFPNGVRAGSYDNVFDLSLASSFSAAFITGAGGGTVLGAREALLNGMTNGTAYLNIHSSAFPGGEIRGFASVVPEPSTYALMATGLGALGAIGWRRRRTA